MNYKNDVQLINITDLQINISQKLWLLLKKFWQFSCFYSDYRANIYFKKRRC